MIQTEGLYGTKVNLLPLSLDHVDGLWEAAQFPEIWTYMPLRVQNKGDVLRMVEKALRAKETGTEFPFAILNRDGQIVGSTRLLDISTADRHAEIGWTWLTPKVWRTSVNTECKFRLLSFCFEELGFLRVQLKTDLRNLRSQQAIARIGAVREGVLRKHRVLSDGYVRDSVYFSILDDEWPTVKQNLLSMMKK